MEGILSSCPELHAIMLGNNPGERILMTSKERMVTAMRRGVPDMVPVSPDMSNMIPARLTGKPFWEIYAFGDPPLGQAYMDAVRRFGFDGWYIYDNLDAAMAGNPITGGKLALFGVSLGPDDFTMELLEQSDERIVLRLVLESPCGQLESTVVMPAFQPPWIESKPIKNLQQDWPKLRWYLEQEWNYRTELHDYADVGEDAIYGLNVELPVDWWLEVRDGGIEAFTYDLFDHPDLMDEVFDVFQRFALDRLTAQLTAKPDEIIFQGSSSSLSLISPAIYSKVNLPFLKKAAARCAEAGIISHQHTCGKSRWIVETAYRETALNVMEPLEPPPGGDVDMGEVKKEFGDSLCLKGNINTFNIMRLGSTADVEEAVKRCIDQAADGGGFILSTGDQLAFDTPLENIEAMVRTARKYGVY